MKHAIALALILAASLALATEKVPDASDHALPGGSRIELTGTLDASSPTWNRSFGSATPTPETCDYPLLDSGNDGQYYDFFCIRATDGEPIEIVVDPDNTGVGDTTLHIFCDPLDPMAPLENAVYYDDDGGEGFLSAIVAEDGVVLLPETDYWLVISTFSPGDTGPFAIGTSDNVALCGGVAVEAADWSSLKGLFR